MIDHMGVGVSDFEKSSAFYQQALEPLGYKKQVELSPDITGDVWVGGFGNGGDPKRDADFWINGGGAQKPHIHVAFRAKSRDEVNAFYEAAIKAGGTDNGKPGLRPQYHASYYAAFVLDPDGHNIEAVFHG